MGTPKKILGFEIIWIQANKQLFIHQKTMIQDLISKYLPPETKISSVPMSSLMCTLDEQKVLEKWKCSLT